ncbi:hypothetical protein [Streptomyces sp. BK340]|uniref:hypothetical protein n=1 Tax=Streptomyces sp. BK340 TaxID=2572903 RepID=UPI0011A241EF|nr:hypothetical protein [Streptomyces sp. BK340]
MSERTAKVIVLLVAAGALVGVVIAFPYIAYFVAGILACRGWDKARAWRAHRAETEPAEDDEEADEVDIVEALQQLGRSVLLTELRAEAGLPDTKTVKTLLGEAGIPWRAGVRTSAGNGPGVHQDDIPASSLVADGDHGERCCCRSDANANTNNDCEEEPEEGLRVQRIGTDGYILYDPKDTVRHHRVK